MTIYTPIDKTPETKFEALVKLSWERSTLNNLKVTMGASTTE